MLGYKIENNIATLFDGDELPEGFMAYELGDEPRELLELLDLQAKNAGKGERIAELKRFLDETQYKFGEDYDRKDTEEWLALKTQRQAWRDELRNLTQGEHHAVR
jgi:hypothetical protein